MLKLQFECCMLDTKTNKKKKLKKIETEEKLNNQLFYSSKNVCWKYLFIYVERKSYFEKNMEAIDQYAE